MAKARHWLIGRRLARLLQSASGIPPLAQLHTETLRRTPSLM